MKVLILSVTYKSYDSLFDFVRSVDLASANCSDAEVTIAIGDNTDIGFQPISIDTQNCLTRVFDYHDNIGYLGCALRMLNEIRSKEQFDYDYVAISNVDLSLSPDFFQQLSNVHSEKSRDIGWIAPDIFTESRKHHENPFMRTRPTATHFLKWRVMYAVPFIYGLLERFSYSAHKSNDAPHNMEDIYAGHGSFILLTDSFVKKHEQITYPCFMYSEEIFLAELCRISNLRVTIFPQLIIENTGSISVSRLGYAWKCKHSLASLNYIYNRFFK